MVVLIEGDPLVAFGPVTAARGLPLQAGPGAGGEHFGCGAVRVSAVRGGLGYGLE